MTQWQSQGLGIQWVTLLLDNPGNQTPPTTSGALTWKNNWGLTKSYVAADPQFSMVPGNSVGTPQFTIIDPRNMTVVHLVEGLGQGSHSTLTNLAGQNK
jgi:hypothetical protein